MKRITQEEWDRRAAEGGLRWLEPVRRGRDSVLAECLTCGHQWRIRPEHVKQGKGCRPCSYRDRGRRQVLPQEVWDERIAAVGAEWLEPVKRNSQKHRARCLTCGHRWSVQPSHIQQGKGCPKCADPGKGRRLETEVWDERIAAVGARWLEPFLGAGKPRLAECLACGHRWHGRHTSVGRGHGCERCAARKRGLTRRVDQEVWDERIAAVGARWLDPVETSGESLPAECLTCGHRWNTQPARVQQGAGCPKCAGQYVSPAEWDERIAAVGARWLDPLGNAHTPVPAECLTCGHRWEPRPQTVARGVGCPICNVGGFDSDAPSLIYLMVKDETIGKIGIMNSGTGRIRLHQSRGFALEETWLVPTGRDARRIEKAVVTWWRVEEQFPPALSKGADGWTETVDLTACTIPEIRVVVHSFIRQVCPEVLKEDYWTEERLAVYTY